MQNAYHVLNLFSPLTKKSYAGEIQEKIQRHEVKCKGERQLKTPKIMLFKLTKEKILQDVVKSKKAR